MARRIKMVFHNYKIWAIGIPKTGSSSLYETFRSEGDGEHGHLNYVECKSHFDFERIKDYYNFAVIRNPYDRFVSGAHQYFRDGNGDPTTDPNHVCTYLEGKDPYALRVLNIMWTPQWTYLVDENGEQKVTNLWRYEELNERYVKFAKDYNEITFNKNKLPENLAFSNVSTRGFWQEELNKNSIRIINELYAKDFEMFGYEMIDPKKFRQKKPKRKAEAVWK